MASLRQIRRRMKSIENIHEITKAMGMIAAFRFKRAENRFSKSKLFFLEMERMVLNISMDVNQTHPLFEKRKIKKKTLVLLSGDKGLCGAYNTNLIRAAQKWLNENGRGDPAGRPYEISLIPVGKVGVELFRKKPISLLSSYPERGMIDPSLARRITEDLKVFFLTGQTDSIEILYTTYRAGGAGQNRILPFLGLDNVFKNEKDSAASDTIYEPDLSSVFRALLDRYLEGKIYLTLLESLTSEFSARMVAMNQATENSDEIIDSLKLLRNKTRQATITRELSEIVSGANALV